MCCHLFFFLSFFFFFFVPFHCVVIWGIQYVQSFCPKRLNPCVMAEKIQQKSPKRRETERRDGRRKEKHERKRKKEGTRGIHSPARDPDLTLRRDFSANGRLALIRNKNKPGVWQVSLFFLFFSISNRPSVQQSQKKQRIWKYTNSQLVMGGVYRSSLCVTIMAWGGDIHVRAPSRLASCLICCKKKKKNPTKQQTEDNKACVLCQD